MNETGHHVKGQKNTSCFHSLVEAKKTGLTDDSGTGKRSEEERREA